MKTYKFFYAIDRLKNVFYSFDVDRNINPYPSYEDMMDDGILVYKPRWKKEMKSDLAEMQKKLNLPNMEIIEEELIL